MNKPQEQRKTGSRKRLQQKQELPLHMMLLPGLMVYLQSFFIEKVLKKYMPADEA